MPNLMTKHTAASMTGLGVPFIYNAKLGNLRNLAKIISNARNGVSSGKIAIAGDSTSAGHGISSGPFYSDRLKSWPAQFANDLSNKGVPTNYNNVFGCSNFGTTTGNNSMANFDARVGFGAGWVIHGQYSAGGRFFNAPSGTTAALSFNFGSYVYDQIDIYYFRNTGNGTLNIDRAGSAPVSGSPFSTAGGASLQKATFNFAAAASGLLNLSNVTVGQVFIMGVAVRNTAVKAIEIYNLAIGGSNSADWDNTAASPYTPRNTLNLIAPDVTIIGHGVNDWNSGTSSVYSNTAPTSIANYTSYLQTAINESKARGDCILFNSFQSDPTAFSSAASQLTYKTAMQSLADSNDIPMFSVLGIAQDYTSANALSYMADQRHGSILGYDIVGRYFSKSLELAGLY